MYEQSTPRKGIQIVRSGGFQSANWDLLLGESLYMDDVTALNIVTLRTIKIHTFHIDHKISDRRHSEQDSNLRLRTRCIFVLSFWRLNLMA